METNRTAQTILEGAAKQALEYLRDPAAAETKAFSATDGNATARELLIDGLADALQALNFEKELAAGEDDNAFINAYMKAYLASGAGMIFAERRRQIEEEGWEPKHDDAHGDGEMAVAAACYACGDLKQAMVVDSESFEDAWPWEAKWDKREKHDRLRQLTIAGALIAAEIDRLNRAAAKAAPAAQ